LTARASLATCAFQSLASDTNDVSESQANGSSSTTRPASYGEEKIKPEPEPRESSVLTDLDELEYLQHRAVVSAGKRKMSLKRNSDDVDLYHLEDDRLSESDDKSGLEEGDQQSKVKDLLAANGYVFC
jgi:hypothetical protein